MSAEALIDIDTEKALLGACMTSQIGMDLALEKVEVSHFGLEIHGIIFKACSALNENGSAIDTVTVADQLRSTQELEMVGGIVYLTSLTSEVATGANASYYAQIIVEKAAARELIDISRDTAMRATRGESVSDLVARADSRIMSLMDTGVDDEGLVPIGKVLEDTMAQISERVLNPGAIYGVTSGYMGLDSSTAGFQGGDLIILAGRTSQGKTALATDLMLNAASDGKGVAFFSTEQRGIQIGERLLAKISGIDLLRLRSGRLTKDELERLRAAQYQVSQWPIWIDDSTGMTPQAVIARSRRMKRANGLAMTIVDYLQYMRWPEQCYSREQEVSKISRSLKDGAKDMEIPIIALAQLSREADKRRGERPILSDLRESGSLEQDSDMVIFIHRPETYGAEDIEMRDGSVVSAGGMALLILAKNRNGPTTEVLMRWRGTITRFEEANAIEAEYTVEDVV